MVLLYLTHSLLLGKKRVEKEREERGVLIIRLLCLECRVRSLIDSNRFQSNLLLGDPSAGTRVYVGGIRSWIGFGIEIGRKSGEVVVDVLRGLRGA